MPKSRVGQCLRIEWEDAWTNSDTWIQSEVDEAPPLIMTLYGYCVRDDKSGITVTMETHPKGGRYRIVWHVPKAMIRKVQCLK